MKTRFLNILALGLMLSPALFAQSIFSPLQIEAALDDKLFELAEQQIWSSLSVQQPLEKQTDLTILLVRALTGQKKFEEAHTLADESSHLLHPDAFAYWKARAYFEADDFDSVSHPLERLPEESPFAPAALRLKGRSSRAANNLKAAQKSFDTFQKKFPNDAEAPQNLLDLGEIYLERDKKKSSVKTLRKLIETFPNAAPADPARLLMARTLIPDGTRKEKAEATILLTQLGGTPSAHPRLRITAWVELAELEKAGSRPAGAADALLNAENLTDETVRLVRQKAARANLLIEEGRTDEAFTLFDEAVAAAVDEKLAAEVLIQKAEALLKTKQFPKAEVAFQACLNVATHPPLLAQALSGKGWSLWEQTHYEEAALAFEQAARKYSKPSDQVEVYVKAGDAHLIAGQYDQAEKNYTLAIATQADHPLAARATYQTGIALQKTKKLEEALRLFRNVERDFPNSDFSARAALQQADLLKSEKKWEPALREYIRIANDYTNTATRAVALHQQGLVHLELNHYAEAQESFFSVTQTYPDAPEAPQAFYMLGFCQYMQGAVQEALDLFTSFIEKYPDSPWVPEVLFLVGEHAYNRGDYPQAQTTFLDIVSRFPQHALADDALFWTGNALLQQDRFLKAFNVYSQIAKDYPQSDLLLATRFAQGEVLSELGEFSRAILAYEEVIKNAPDHSLSTRARGRLGDCLFTLGSTESGRHQEALKVYQALYKHPSISLDLKLQVLFKIARCEDKMGNQEDAFSHYMEAVYSLGELKEPLSPGALHWFTRAAFEAAAYQERQQNWQAAIHIYERLIEAGVPAQDEAKKLIAKIKKDRRLE